MADECGDAYFWCGKALLDLARQEGGILGDAIPGGVQYILCCLNDYMHLFTINGIHVVEKQKNK